MTFSRPSLYVFNLASLIRSPGTHPSAAMDIRVEVVIDFMKSNLEKEQKAIGTFNDNNGVMITLGKVRDGEAAETSFGHDTQGKPLFAKEVDGKYVANVVVTFGSLENVNLEPVAHEGSHVEDRQNLIKAFQEAYEKNPLMTDDEAKSLPGEIGSGSGLRFLRFSSATRSAKGFILFS